jgi:hypothetical protein
VSDLDSVALREELPEITLRSHGISTGKVAKGKYKGPDNARYHLLIDKPVGQILTLYPKKGIPVLISLAGMDEQALYKQISEDLYSNE